MSTTKRITKRLLAVILTVLMLMSMVAIGITSVSAATITGGTTLYLDASSWGYSNARFAAYFCNGSSAATWVDMELAPGETSTYQVTVPDGQSHKNVIFGRMNPATTDNNFNNGVKWNQTGDLTWDGTKNCFKPSGWDGSTTTWSVYTPPVLPNPGEASTFNLMGTLTDWATGKNMVYAEDVAVVTTTLELPAGEQKLKIKDNNNNWMGNGQITVSLAEGGTMGTPDNDGNFVVTLTGGIYTFNYTIATKKLEIAYEAATVDAPATLSDATVVPAVVDGTTGDGTEVNPYIVNCNIPNTELTITATPNGEATGFVYAIDGGAQVTVAADTWTATTSVETPADGASKKVTVKLWAYNSKLGTTELSAEPITKDITIEGFDTVVKMPVELDVTGWAEDGATYTVQYILPATGEDEGVATAAEAANVVEMTTVEGETNIYTANIPEATTQVIFSKTVGETTISTDAIDISTDSNRYAIAGVTEDGTVTGDWYVEPPFSKTAYFINSAKWEAVTAHIWTEGGDIPDLTTWPGMEMTKTEDTVNGYDVYSVTVGEDYQNIIFNNNGGGQQTDDLTFEDGQYYYLADKTWYPSLEEVPAIDPLATNRYLLGGFNNWNATANEFKLNAEGDTTGYVTLTLEANTAYEFKVIREGAWTSNTTAITGTVEGLTFSSSVSGNAKITTTVAGDYTFGFGLENSQLSVTYPVAKTVYFDANDLGGVTTDTVILANGTEMTLLDDGVYTAEIADGTDITFSWQVTDEEGVPAQYTALAVQNAENNLYTLTALTEEGFTGEWSVYTTTDPDDPDDPDIPVVENVTVFVVNSKNWDAINAYAWFDDGITTDEQLSAWPGVALQKTDMQSAYGSDVYAMSFDSKFVSVIFNNGTQQTEDLKVMDGQYYDLSNKAWYATLEEVPEPIPEPDPYKIYLEAGLWDADDALMVAYVWSDNVAATWHTMTDADGDGTYEVEIPAENVNIIFVRMDSKATEPSWDYKWNQSVNLTIPTDGNNLFTFTDAWAEAGATGAWSVYEAPVVKETIYFNVNDVVTLVEGDVITVNGVEMEADGNMYSAEIEVAEEIVFEITSGETVTTITAAERTEEGQNYYTLTEVVEEAIVGTWSEYIPYVDPLATNVVLVGDFNGWDPTANEFKLNAEGEKVGYTTLTLESGTYTFKVLDNDAWLGNNGTIDVTCEGWTFKEGTDDCTFNALAGTYTFSFDTETKKLTIEATDVEYPDYSVTFNEGNFTVAGEATVTYGNDYTFTVEPDAGYVITQVLNGEEELTAVDGVYTITSVKSDINITITTEADKVLPNQVFTAIYLDIDGNIILADKRVQGTEVTLMPGPAVEGHIFKGWTPVPETLKEDGTFILDKDYVFIPVYEEDNNDLPIIPVDPEVPDEPTVKTWTVIFVDDSGKYLGYQTVEDGKDATLPEVPAKAGYEFTGWDGEHTNVTENRTITAIYTKNATPPVVAPTTGTLKIDITGGTSFTLNGRPQGTSYHNTQMAIGTEVTVVANSSTGNEFIGWVLAANGEFVSKTPEFTFIASGNDSYKALYQVEVEGVQTVTFVNDRMGALKYQVLDMQYYSATETIAFPANTFATGYTFKGWKLEGDTTNTPVTNAMIQSEIAKGNDVTIVPIWEKLIVYVTLTVNGGTGGGQVVANTGTTVTANAAPAGQKFAYWVDGDGIVKSYLESYKLYPATDMELTAVFVPEDEVVDEQILLGIDNVEINNDNNGLRFVLSWYVPEEYNYVQGGIVAVDKVSYSESTFYANSTASGMYTRGPSGANNTAIGGYTWNKKDINYGDTWVAKAYIQYKDATGQVVTVYGDTYEYTKTEDGVIANLL